MEKKEIIRQLKGSLEISTLGAWAIGYNLLVAAVCCVTALGRGFSWEEFPAAVGIALLVMLAPMDIILLIRAVKIFRAPEYYQFYRTKLTQPKGGRIRDTIRFTVLLEDADGRFVVDTHSIFLTHGFAGPLLEDYVNQTVTIAYNHLTEEVVVIG